MPEPLQNLIIMIRKDAESLKEVIESDHYEYDIPKLNAVRCVRQQCETSRIFDKGVKDHLSNGKTDLRNC